MKGVYEQNAQLGDPSSLEPQITETAQNMGRLKGELAKYEVIAALFTESFGKRVTNCKVLTSVSVSDFFILFCCFALFGRLGSLKRWEERSRPMPSITTLSMRKKDFERK